MITSELGGLTRLNALNLTNNSLNGVIPSELFSIKTLETLALSQNNMHGMVPFEMEGQQNLSFWSWGSSAIWSFAVRNFQASPIGTSPRKRQPTTWKHSSPILTLSNLELINIVDSGLAVDQIPPSVCDASPERIVAVRSPDSMYENEEGTALANTA
jgi:hypothetical protein